MHDEETPATAAATVEQDDAVARALERELYKTQEAELFKRELSNSENYDKSLLAYASGGLGLSLTFIKDVVPFATARYLALLELSWLSFVGAIVLVLASFQISQLAIRRQIDLASRYYLKREAAALNEENRFATWTGRVNVMAGILFLCGVLLTTVFVWTNLGRPEVADKAPATPLCRSLRRASEEAFP